MSRSGAHILEVTMTDKYTMDDIYTIYDQMDEKLKFITTSGVRIKMMASLFNGPKTSSQLKDNFNVGASTIIHAARDLEKERMLVEMTDGYHLTSVGRVIAMAVIDMLHLLSVVDKIREFLLSHQTEHIPPTFLRRLGELKGLKIVKSSPTNLLHVLTLYTKLVSQTQVFDGVSPVFVPEFGKIVKKILKRGDKVNLVITREILEPVLDIYKKDMDKETMQRVREGNLNIWVTDDVKIAITVTDSLMSLGLFNADGTYDFSHDLISYENGAINWGRDVFEYYRNRAKSVALE
jgi:predicted transcriptional regulator